MRYAIYLAPAATHPLWVTGNRWLGRDPETGDTLAQPGVAGLAPNEVEAVTAAPRRYGLHATIKAPFHLAPGRDEAELTTRLGRFSAAWQPFDLPQMEVAALQDFIALQLRQPCPALHALADACVTEFDDFRAPPDAAELARRQPETLSEGPRALLARWGYPYVFENFRFHVTLTGATPTSLRTRLQPWLAEHFASGLAQPCRVDGLALYVEPFPHASFRLVRRFPFAGDIAA